MTWNTRTTWVTQCGVQSSEDDDAKLNKTNQKITCTFNCQVSRCICTVLVLVVTSSLCRMSDRAVSPRERRHRQFILHNSCMLHIAKTGHLRCCLYMFSCSQLFFSYGFLFLLTKDGKSFFIRIYRIEFWRLLRTQNVESFLGITFPGASPWYFRLLSCGHRHGHDRIVLSLCSWFTLLQKTRVWFCVILHRTLLSMEFLYVCGTFAILATSWFFCRSDIH